MSQVLHLSQNVAGVTLLALGNGSPDIFSAFAAINQDEDKKSSLAVGALFGKLEYKCFCSAAGNFHQSFLPPVIVGEILFANFFPVLMMYPKATNFCVRFIYANYVSQALVA